jgi:RNA polymerase sigma-70 factor (ECF subfamily)
MTGEEFAQLFTAQASYVGHSLRRLGVRDADLEDVTHEVFLVVHRIWPTYDASRPLRPWLFGVAFRVASDYRRLAYVVRERATDSAEIAAPAVRTADPERELQRHQTRTQILAALEAIAIDRRAVFILHEIDETPIPEVAAALAIPLNTAYSRLRTARVEFKEAFVRLSTPFLSPEGARR